MIDRSRIEDAVSQLLDAIGEDTSREGLRDTPRRVADMYVELFEGLNANPGEHLRVTFEASYDEMVMVRDIPFTSLCEHHLLPFVGVAHVAYIPGEEGRITGLSKLVRLVEGFARRLQVQERLTTDIVEAIEHELRPTGSIVIIEAEHFCMSMRGVKNGPLDCHIRGAWHISIGPIDKGGGVAIRPSAKTPLLMFINAG